MRLILCLSLPYLLFILAACTLVAICQLEFLYEYMDIWIWTCRAKTTPCRVLTYIKTRQCVNGIHSRLLVQYRTWYRSILIPTDTTNIGRIRYLMSVSFVLYNKTAAAAMLNELWLSIQKSDILAKIPKFSYRTCIWRPGWGKSHEFPLDIFCRKGAL